MQEEDWEDKQDKQDKEGKEENNKEVEDDPGCEAHRFSNLFEEGNTLHIVWVRLLCP